MKEYFAKYLPVEGKIKEGDTFLTKSGNLVKAISKEHAERAPRVEAKLVKLSICSRDIQVGDMVHQIVDGKETEEFEWDHYMNEQASLSGKPNLFKAIGKISPEAIWVRDGDEFDKEDLLANGTGVNWNNSSKNLNFKVKCPTCKTFH